MSNKKEVLFLREEYGEGRGKYIYPNGEKYVRNWKNGKYHGQGTFTTFEGDKYVGEFKDEKFWNGTTYEIDGNIYVSILFRRLTKAILENILCFFTREQMYFWINDHRQSKPVSCHKNWIPGPLIIPFRNNF